MKNSLENKEIPYSGRICGGFLILAICILIILLAIWLVSSVLNGEGHRVAMVCGAAFIELLLLRGLFSLQPNQSVVMIFFGEYRGTFRKTGFYWVNPFMSRKKVSLRIRNMNIEPIKVNDKIGNPVMIGMVLVWKIKDTYRAVFDIDAGNVTTIVSKKGDIELSEKNSSDALSEFVRIQSDAALREVTGQFAYDNEDQGDVVTLRSGSQVIVDLLEEKLNERLSMAGIEIVEARLNYLAYAPEIAAVMLRRQQASAIISAREKIVEGAVSMVKMALSKIEEEGVVTFDDERKASMVSNLLVVLCADEPAQPVVSTGAMNC